MFSSCLRLMAFLSRADCIFMSLREQGNRLHLDTTSAKAHFVLDAGEALVCCALTWYPSRQRTHCCEGAFLQRTCVSWGSHSGRLHHPLMALTRAPHIRPESVRNKGPFSWPGASETLAPPCLQPLSFQWPSALFWLLATFPAQGKTGYLPNLDWNFVWEFEYTCNGKKK